MESAQYDLGANLRRIRETRGLTQAALAAKAGMSRNYVAALEGGRIASPGVQAIYAIADAMGVRIEAIMGRPSLGQ